MSKRKFDLKSYLIGGLAVVAFNVIGETTGLRAYVENLVFNDKPKVSYLEKIEKIKTIEQANKYCESIIDKEMK